MPRRGSRLAKFFREGLSDAKYPNLFWVDEDKGQFALSSVHRSNSRWKPDDCRLYEDWVKENEKSFSRRRSTDPKQRLNAALKKSRFLKFIAKVSEYSIYSFVESHLLPKYSDDSLSESENVPGPYSPTETNATVSISDFKLDEFQDLESFASAVDAFSPKPEECATSYSDQFGNPQKISGEWDSCIDEVLRKDLSNGGERGNSEWILSLEDLLKQQQPAQEETVQLM